MPGTPLFVSSRGYGFASNFTSRLTWKFALWFALFARGAVEQVSEPAAAGSYWRRDERRCFGGAARRWCKAGGVGALHRARRTFVAWRNLVAWGDLITATDDRECRLLAYAAYRLDRVEISTVASDDTIELSQRFNLV